jgi:hypothetical protein
MIQLRLHSPHFLILALLLNGLGCQDHPTRVSSPTWRPQSLAQAALDHFDSNGDGTLDTTELESAPALAAGAKLLDVDKDQRVSAAELEQRFGTYKHLAVGRTSPAIRFLINGQPLVNATVEFIPEPFLSDVIKPATATTNQQGLAYPQIQGDPVPGLQVGYYRVQVSSADGRVPPKYHDATPLGVEISGTNDDPAGYSTFTFRLDGR